MNGSFPRALRVSLVVEVPLSQQHVPIHNVPKRFGASRMCLRLI